MFGPPGHAYVYLIYGIHHCLNVVSATPQTPAAILVRALEPIEGIDVQRQLRGEERTLEELTSGPGRLCQALDIDRHFDGADLCASEAELWLEPEPEPTPVEIAQGPRIGVTGDERALTVPWRFYVQGNSWVSR
jgi:DNA-3-methyladenine glycosylase